MKKASVEFTSHEIQQLIMLLGVMANQDEAKGREPYTSAAKRLREMQRKLIAAAAEAK
jgi:hypothetical protein